MERRFRPAGVRSLVHTGGVLVGYVLSTGILGVVPTGPGFAECRIHPRPGDLTWGRGAFPAPQGDIRVEWERANGALRLKTEVPEGIEAEVVVDRGPDRPQTLTHNGTTTDLQDPAAVAAAGLSFEPGAVHIRVHGGSHTWELTDLPA